MTHLSYRLADGAVLIERLRKLARDRSEISRHLAESKSLRQADNPEGRTDLYMWSQPEQMEEWKAADLLESLAQTMRHIEELRANFGSVTILCDDEEASTRAKQMAVECCGEWTGWEVRRFYGEHVADCLAKAGEAKKS